MSSDVDLDDVGTVLGKLVLDRTVAPVKRFAGGTSAARKHLDRFLVDGLAAYGTDRGRSDEAGASMLAPYLHFGQISPVEITLKVRQTAAPAAAAGFVEQLVVRRELTFNHVFYADDYDQYEGLPEWARKTLTAHRHDPRPHSYDLDGFAAGRTHDTIWNVAMKEMRVTGYLHNRLRMYWGKKIIEWSVNPETAFTSALALNNRYFLDGRDPNSYANIAWLFGLHDRPWPARPIFGNIRSMGLNSLKGLDPAAYAKRVDALAATETGATTRRKKR